MKDEELLKKIIEKFPDLASAERDIKTVESSPDKKLAEKLGVSFPKKAPKIMKVFTFRKNVSFGDSLSQKVTRVTIDEDGIILKVSQSK